jgi:hypothetical protein
MSSAILHVAVGYGPAVQGKSCDNCVYSDRHIARGLVCSYYDRPTIAHMRCGLWLSARVPEVKTEQAEQPGLF